MADFSVLFGNPPEVAGRAAGTLASIVENIIGHPHEGKYRSVNIRSSAFFSNVWSTPGGPEAMASLGFVQEGLKLNLPAGTDLNKFLGALDQLESKKSGGGPSGSPGGGLAPPAAAGEQKKAKAPINPVTREIRRDRRERLVNSRLEENPPARLKDVLETLLKIFTNALGDESKRRIKTDSRALNTYVYLAPGGRGAMLEAGWVEVVEGGEEYVCLPPQWNRQQLTSATDRLYRMQEANDAVIEKAERAEREKHAQEWAKRMAKMKQKERGGVRTQMTDQEAARGQAKQELMLTAQLLMGDIESAMELVHKATQPESLSCPWRGERKRLSDKFSQDQDIQYLHSLKAHWQQKLKAASFSNPNAIVPISDVARSDRR